MSFLFCYSCPHHLSNSTCVQGQVSDFQHSQNQPQYILSEVLEGAVIPCRLLNVVSTSPVQTLLQAPEACFSNLLQVTR